MKKIILIVTCAAALSAYALPTYEPFTEYASQVASSTLLLAVTNASGVALGTNANTFLTNCIDLATGGYTAPSGEQWGALYFSGTGNNNTAPAGYHGLDIAVVTNNSIFTSGNLPSIFPSGFPGIPTSGGISPILENPAQPLIWWPTISKFTATNYCGNSAVLKFAQDITRPTSGTKTVYVSYLLDVAQLGQLGSGNNGRYLGFLASTNLVEGTNLGPTVVAYTNWAAMFNTFNGNSASGVHYASHGLLSGGSGYYIGACDSYPGSPNAGRNWTSTPLTAAFGTPIFVVGEYVLNSGATADTNIVWVNPSTGSFGGATPPASGNHVWTMGFNMTDLGGMVFIDRLGNNASGGVGTNYIANLMIGSTWSYVTGGPEFTNQPPANTSVPLGGTASITGLATAAGQNVSYQWYDLTTGSNMVSGANSSTLTIPNFSSANVGNYVLVATANSTGLALASTTAALVLADPQVTANPANTTANYGQTATFTATVTTAHPPLTYGWWFGGSLIASGTATGSSPFTVPLTLNNVSYQNIGSYTLYVTNGSGFNNNSVPATATLSVNDPYIVTQPGNPAVASGGNATFTVVASGSSTVGYQWYENGIQLVDNQPTATGSAIVSGSQTATLTLTGVQDADNGGYYCTVSGSASLQTTNSATATLVVQDPLTIVTSPMSLVQRAGDHVAFSVGVSGGGPQFQWYAPNGSPIIGATNSALVLTNIQTSNNGTYRVAVGNAATAYQNFYPTLTVINSTVLNFSSTNLVVARMGDGAQALSAATGNTLYLDQYTTSGNYVNSTQIPDEGTGQPYGTGSANSTTMPAGSPALLVAGAGSDAGYEAMLTLSPNQEYLGFAGYCLAYPYSGADVTAGAQGGAYWRGLATINAFGIYSLAYTNSGLYSGGNHTIRSMVTLDGTNFWTTGQANSGTVKFVSGSMGANYANGAGVPSSSGVSAAGGRNVQIVSGALAGFSSGPNLVVTDAGQSPSTANGLWAASGVQEPATSGTIIFTPLLYTGGGQPGDFAFSPDNQTIYVAESAAWTGAGPGTGGIERWDTNTTGPSGWVYSYTLPALPGGATNGALGLVVNWNGITTWGSGVTGAKIYATSTGAAGNSLVEIVDNGASSTPTVLATAGPNQALRGVRFGPAAIAPAIAGPPQTNTVPLGNPATFSVAATGSAPLFYQWYFGGAPLAGATQSSFTTNNVSYASAGNYELVVSNLTTLIASVTNVLVVTAGAPTVSALPGYTETEGDHLAFAPTITGTQPITNYWYFGSTLVQSNVTPGANGSLALTNIQPANNGTYRVYVTNLYAWASSTGTLTVTASRQNLSSTNLVVTRIGDGAQALSGATGNTLYLDQYTPSGGYVNTIQIPDEGTGQPYGTGSANSASMPFGSPALLVAGAGSDASYEGLLTLAPNQETLSFAGYCQAYPFAGADVTVSAGNGGNQWRGIGTVNAYGYYTLAWTNTGLYSEGNHTVHSAFDIDGSGVNFYTAGQAGGGNGIKYCDPANELCPGTCIPGITGSFPGTRVVQVVGGNLVFSDAGPGVTTNGIYACLGLPTAVASSGLMIAETNSPMDFASSTNLQTVYIADNGTFGGTSVQAGGIQRWDANGTSAYGYPTYAYSYTLGTGTGSTVGARGLTVDWSQFTGTGIGTTGEGAILYATTAESSGNRLIKIVDNGAASPATVLTSAGSSQILAGVRLGPVVVPPSFAIQPQATNALAGSSVTFSVDALGSGPLTYQWYFQANCTGSFHTINLATNDTYTINSAGSGNVGCYYVVVTNPGGSTLQSDTVAFSLAVPPQFVPPYPGPANAGNGYNAYQLNFTGPAGSSYTIWTSTDVSLTPVQSYWGVLTTGTFSGGIDSYTDPNGGANPQQFYKITSP